MMQRRPGWLSHALVRVVLPEAAREPVLGDLSEEGLEAGTPRHMAALLGLAAYLHLEPYRDQGARLRVAVLTLAGMGLVWIVRAASWGAEPPLELFRDPLSRAALHVWSGGHLTSSAAAGLAMGHLPGIPRFAEPARWHGVLLVAFLAGWTPAASSWSAAPAVLLILCAWLGWRARRDSEPARPA